MDVRHTVCDQPRLTISREALLHNLRLIRRQIPHGTQVCAMVKADAYGHGADLVVDTLCSYAFDGVPCPAVEQLAVATIDEAAALPETGLPVLVLRAVENVYVGPARQAIEFALKNQWILTIGTPSAADDVARVAMAIHERASVHIMLDTGMTRCGCSIENLPRLLQRIEGHSALRLVSIGSHFATADVPDHPYIHEQLRRFRTATDALASERAGKIIRHLANSGGIFFAPGSHFDMVRPGISLYGIDPTLRPSIERPLRPVARWSAPLISILDVKAGATIGYGQSFKTERDTRIGLVPIGYADGYPRLVSNRAYMMVGGIACPVVGRVSMDLTTIDLHDVPQPQIGDEVVVMSDDPLSPASPYALADAAQTIPYELFTRIGQRVKRVAVERESRSFVQT